MGEVMISGKREITWRLSRFRMLDLRLSPSFSHAWFKAWFKNPLQRLLALPAKFQYYVKVNDPLFQRGKANH